MSKVETDVYTFKDDVGKNLYRKTTYYTLKIEQDVLAKDKDEADQKFCIIMIEVYNNEIQRRQNYKRNIRLYF